MPYRHLKTTRSGGVEWLVLNRPETHNTLNADVIAELTDWANSVRTSGDVRVAVLAGAGTTFSAGANVAWMAGTIDYGEAENLRDASALSQMFVALDTLPIPVVGRVQGAALGGGAGLATVKGLVADVSKGSGSEIHALTARVIAARRVSAEGQEGLRAFLDRRKPRGVGGGAGEGQMPKAPILDPGLPGEGQGR